MDGKGELMALNDLEDRLESAIRHINTSLDIDPWAQNLAVESMRMRIALMKGKQPEIIRCKDCKHYKLEVGDERYALGWCPFIKSHLVMSNGFCAWAERRTDEPDK